MTITVEFVKSDFFNLYGGKDGLAAAANRAQKDIDECDVEPWNKIREHLGHPTPLTMPNTTMTPTLGVDTPERWDLRRQIIEDIFSGATAASDTPYYVGFIGLPRSGKSILGNRPTYDIDCDRNIGTPIISFEGIACRLPEYDNFLKSRDPRISSALRHEISGIMNAIRTYGLKERLSIKYETLIAEIPDVQRIKDLDCAVHIIGVHRPFLQCLSSLLKEFGETSLSLPSLPFILARHQSILKETQNLLSIPDITPHLYSVNIPTSQPELEKNVEKWHKLPGSDIMRNIDGLITGCITEVDVAAFIDSLLSTTQEADIIHHLINGTGGVDYPENPSVKYHHDHQR